MSILAYRNRQILAHHANGMEQTEIAKLMCFSYSTIRKSCVKIRSVLNARNLTQATVFAIHMGEIEINDSGAAVAVVPSDE